MISFRRFALRRGSRLLLSDIDLVIQSGWRLGVVGRNGCGKTLKKPLAQRWHQCACGVGPVQRDLYAAFLAAYLDPAESIPSCARYVIPREGAGVGGEARLRDKARPRRRLWFRRTAGWRQ